MSERTKIEWADDTRNAVNGCSVLSPGCTNCYAMRLAGTRLRTHPSRAGLTQPSKAGPVWTGEVRLNERELLAPLRQKRGRRIFWNAHGDLFHEAVPDAWIDRLFAVCALTPQHTHMVLTKRSARMREYLTAKDMPARVIAQVEAVKPSILWNGSAYEATTRLALRAPLTNVWLGVSVEDQARADERVPDLLATPAAVRFISAEPLLGPVELTEIQARGGDYEFSALEGQGHTGARIDWVIAGGESGPGARPMHPDWARLLRDQCHAAGVAFHFKQWGEWYPAFANDYAIDASTVRETREIDEAVVHRLGKKLAGRRIDGRTHDEFPA